MPATFGKPAFGAVARQAPGTPEPPPRAPDGRLLPGRSLNPKGRPRAGTAFAEAVREHVDPLELIRIAKSIARGEPAVRDLLWLRNKAEADARGVPPPSIEGVEVVWPTQSERLAALTFLRDSGYQRPVQQLELTQGPAIERDYSKLSDAELDQLEALHAKAAGALVAPVSDEERLGAIDVPPGQERPA